MNSKTAVNAIGMIAVYLIAAAVLFLLPPSALGPTGDQDQQLFLETFRHNALTLLGISFACAALWFVLAEWVISAWVEMRTRLIAWFAILLIVVGASIVMAYRGPKPGPSDPANHTVPTYYALGGIMTFYLASVLFSPSNAKFAVWPARHVRRAW